MLQIVGLQSCFTQELKVLAFLAHIIRKLMHSSKFLGQLTHVLLSRFNVSNIHLWSELVFYNIQPFDTASGEENILVILKQIHITAGNYLYHQLLKHILG
jgi:hypothetical protein